jgi:hypothetical protein
VREETSGGVTTAKHCCVVMVRRQDHRQSEPGRRSGWRSRRRHQRGHHLQRRGARTDMLLACGRHMHAVIAGAAACMQCKKCTTFTPSSSASAGGLLATAGYQAGVIKYPFVAAWCQEVTLATAAGVGQGDRGQLTAETHIGVDELPIYVGRVKLLAAAREDRHVHC